MSTISPEEQHWINQVKATYTELENVSFRINKLLISFIIVCFFIGSSVVMAGQGEVPYDANTEDECIQEKECIWYHFLLSIQQNPMESKATKAINAKKWMEPVTIRIEGSLREYNDDYIKDNYLNKIAPYFYQELNTGEKYNFLIQFTDDIEKELATEFDWVFKKLTGENTPLKIYRSQSQKDTCHYFHVQHPQQTSRVLYYFVFIQKDHSNIDACLREAVYSGFGLSNAPKSQIWNASKKQAKYSKLERLLLIMLYRMPVVNGMAYEEIKSAFDKTYPTTMKFVNEFEAFNDY